VRGGTAGTGCGDGDRAPGTYQQNRCEHANTCSEAQKQRNHHRLPHSHTVAGKQSDVC
jgi:hypothetical protein